MDFSVSSWYKQEKTVKAVVTAERQLLGTWVGPAWPWDRCCGSQKPEVHTGSSVHQCHCQEFSKNVPDVNNGVKIADNDRCCVLLCVMRTFLPTVVRGK